MKSNSKYLMKNIGLLTLGQFGTKLLSFFLVPLYTNILSTTEYGVYDLYSTTILLLVPITTANISDAALRYPLDKDSNKQDIVSVCVKRTLYGIGIMLVLVLCNHMFQTSSIIEKYFFFSNKFFEIGAVLDDYAFLLLLMFISHAINGIFVNLSRGLENIKQVAISGVICSAVMIGLNIIFLLPLNMGLLGYFLANILGTIVQSGYLLIATDIKKYFRFIKTNKTTEREMILYSRPLMINSISWWISSASDRYVVVWLCDVAASGIYSVGYKIPSILNIFQNIFNQAWTLSAVHDYDADDKSGFFTSMYNVYNFSMLFICSVLVMGTKILATFLYAKEFYNAWQYVPFLIIATFFGALSGYIGGIFAAVKDSKIFARSSIIGAIVNIVFNLILVSLIGPLGAAISTMISYLLVWGIRVVSVKKYMNLRLNLFRDVVAYVLLCIQAIVLFFIEKHIYIYLLEILLLLIILALYRAQFGTFVNKFIRRRKKENAR